MAMASSSAAPGFGHKLAEQQAHQQCGNQATDCTLNGFPRAQPRRQWVAPHQLTNDLAETVKHGNQ
jgi:hypothetical protein